MWPLLSWVELFSWKADGLEKRGLGPTAATDAAGSKNKTKHAIRVILGATCLESGRQRPAPHASTGQFGSPKSRVGTRIKCTPSTTCDSLAQEPQQGSASPCSKIASCSPLAGSETGPTPRPHRSRATAPARMAACSTEPSALKVSRIQEKHGFCLFCYEIEQQRVTSGIPV